MTAESTVCRLAAALYPGRAVWTVAVPQQRRAPDRCYVLCGRGHSHTTLGRGATEADAWADAAATLRREIADAIACERRDRDRAQAEIERLTAALEAV